MFLNVKRFYMIGIGGSGMNGIARILKSMGYEVSGSDARESTVVEELRSLQMEIHIGHDAKQITDADVIVRSTAVKDDNTEVLEARRRGIPVIRRGELLAELTRLGNTIAIAGTHGKTSTTSMIATVLSEAGYDPTVIIGGRVKNLPESSFLGKGRYLVVEADESDGSFLKLNPALGVVTNIDSDHLDYYGTMEILRDSFITFLNNVPFYGVAAVCWDDPNVRIIREKLTRKIITYGTSEEADVRAQNLSVRPDGCTFTVTYGKDDLGEFNISVPGRHNVLNALAAISVALEIHIPIDDIRPALKKFTGVARRFEKQPTAGDIEIYDDYGHHPTEIKATLETIREIRPDGNIYVLFQPHRFTRTKILADEFGGAFKGAKEVYITAIYSAGESSLNGTTSESIIKSVSKKGDMDVSYIDDWKEGIAKIVSKLEPGDSVVTLGAGDIDQAAVKISEEVHARFG